MDHPRGAEITRRHDPDGRRQARTTRRRTAIGVSVALRFGDIDEARAVFEQLSDGGAVASPFGATFYSPGCGTTRDRYGTSWLVMTTESR
ncbi:hypothetical protein QWZ10_03735 [Paracoccus cavernae]|uniref:VOC family protein n=1 Tax=Paracoccus cavernae TaxID=1571207 RepID=A0ABT8D6W6_9RHOB|nr:hypothetical protein [Paracoccus cavernae]